MILILSILVGAVLGTRFKVLCLVPTAVASGAAISTFNFVTGMPVNLILQTVLALGIGLQIGYLAGIAVRSVLISLRRRIADGSDCLASASASHSLSTAMLISNRARKQARAALSIRSVSPAESDRNSLSMRPTLSASSELTRPAPSA